MSIFFRKSILNTKLHIQCKRIENLQYFFFLLICILMGKVLNKLGNLTIFINHLMFSTQQTRLLPILTIEISISLMIE